MAQLARAQHILLLPLPPSFQSHMQLPMLNRKDEGQFLLHTFHINIGGTQKMPSINANIEFAVIRLYFSSSVSQVCCKFNSTVSDFTVLSHAS